MSQEAPKAASPENHIEPSHSSPEDAQKLKEAQDKLNAAKASGDVEATKSAQKLLENLMKPKEVKPQKDAGGEEKKAGMWGNAAKASAVVGGTVIGGFFAGVWGLFKLYGEALFGDVMPKGGGGGGKKSGGGGHGGGHGGGGHH